MTVILEIEFDKNHNLGMCSLLSEGDSIWILGQQAEIKKIILKED